MTDYEQGAYDVLSQLIVMGVRDTQVLDLMEKMKNQDAKANKRYPRNVPDNFKMDSWPRTDARSATSALIGSFAAYNKARILSLVQEKKYIEVNNKLHGTDHILFDTIQDVADALGVTPADMIVWKN